MHKDLDCQQHSVPNGAHGGTNPALCGQLTTNQYRLPVRLLHNMFTIKPISTIPGNVICRPLQLGELDK
jgi:hypothetical protein